jgi:hypothetical protein
LKIDSDVIFLVSDLIFIVFELLIDFITGGLRRTAPLTAIVARKDAWLDI